MLNFSDMKRKRLSSRLLGLTVASIFFCVSSVYGQQQGRDTISSSSIEQDGPKLVTISYSYAAIAELSGGQFQVHYDPQVATLVDKTDCLSNLPETHRSNFSICKAFPEKGIVQFTVLDLGQNRPIGAAPLGSLTFRVSSRRSALATDRVFQVKEVGLAGPDGRHLKTVSAKEKEQAIKIAIQD